MNKRCHLFLAAILFFAFSANMAFAEKKGNKASYSVSCIAFYNLENLFDTINDPAINDEEYLPDGPNKWNSLKYNSKLENMAYAISKIGLDVSPVGPVILGVAEIENRGVLEDLVKQPAIKDRNYQIVHYDSPDRRGVDVGLLYNPDYFTVTNTASHRLHVPENPELKTRDQLLVSGYVQGEKIHVIVNHWPSRYGGELYSRPNRNAAAALTKSICDSIYRKEPKAKIIIMGDLNDDPSNESCAVVLGAKKTARMWNHKDISTRFGKRLTEASVRWDITIHGTCLTSSSSQATWRMPTATMNWHSGNRKFSTEIFSLCRKDKTRAIRNVHTPAAYGPTDIATTSL